MNKKCLGAQREREYLTTKTNAERYNGKGKCYDTGREKLIHEKKGKIKKR